MISTYPIQQEVEKEIPAYLVKEIIYGKKYYYKGYQEVLSNHKKLEDIMGASRLQTAIVSALMILFGSLFRKKYKVMGSEAGLHLEKKENLSLDLAIFKKSDLPVSKMNEQYFNEVPLVVIEVDVKIDLKRDKDHDYVFQKTQKLLDFGTKQVIWILTKSRKVMIAKPEQPWTINNWNTILNVLGHEFELEEFLIEEEIMEAKKKIES